MKTSNEIIYRIYPVFKVGTAKSDMHSRPLGIVHASSEEEALKKASLGKWVKTYADFENYDGEMQARY